MSQNIPSKPINWWNWLLSKLGWISNFNWIHLVVLVLAVIGFVAILKRLFGGGGSSSSSTAIYPSERRGFTTRAYTANPKLSDFSVPKEIYNFRMPSPGIKTGGLTGQLKVNIDKGKKLFVPPTSTVSQTKSNKGPDWTKARKLFVPHTAASSQAKSNKGPDWNLAQKLFVLKAGGTRESNQSFDTGKMSQLGQTNSGPEWELAGKLFVPNFGTRRK